MTTTAFLARAVCACLCFSLAACSSQVKGVDGEGDRVGQFGQGEKGSIKHVGDPRSYLDASITPRTQ